MGMSGDDIRTNPLRAEPIARGPDASEAAAAHGTHAALRLPAALLLAGQLSYIVVTLFHADGDANNHAAVFVEYTGSASWTAVHLGQFACMAILLAGLLALSFALDRYVKAVRWATRFGAAAATAALALYGALQAVDGVALKQAVNAWARAAEVEKATRFASAEAIRWVEWGVRGEATRTSRSASLWCCSDSRPRGAPLFRRRSAT